jgi:hypothetical protein
LHLQIIAGALRHVRMAAYKTTNELPPPPPPSFFSFALFILLLCSHFFSRAAFTCWIPVSISGLQLLFFTVVPLFFIRLFPISFICGLLSFSISRFLIHFHYCSQFVPFLSLFRWYGTLD